MQSKPQTHKITNKTENIATLSPNQNKLGVMKVSKFLRPEPFVNKCRRCRISNACISAQIEKKKLKTLKQLRFASHKLNTGEILCQQGELHEHIYAVQSGSLKSYITHSNGRESVIGFHLPPDIFGWEGIDSQHLSTNIVALEQTNVCVIPLEQWERICAEIPELNSQLLRLISQKIRYHNKEALKTNTEERVANFLLQLMDFYQKVGYPSYLCKLPMSYQDIAHYLRITPETISRTFKHLQEKNAIRVSKSSKRKLYIKDMKLLKSIAGD